MAVTVIRNQQIPVVGKYDVIVVGGGPAGFIAATAAGRCGASVALVERYGYLGGMATAGTVAPISEYMHEGELIVGGIPLEFAETLEKMGAGTMCKPRGNFTCHPEYYKLVAQRMVLGAGVKLYYHSFLSGCGVEDGKITHIIMETKEGSMALEANYFIDATGDGDLAFMAGVPMQEQPENLQPMTLCFTLDKVKCDMIPGYYPGDKGSSLRHVAAKLNEIRKTEQIPLSGGPWCVAGLGDGYAFVNMSRTSGDYTKVEDATAAECTLRENVHTLHQLLKENFEEFTDSTIISTAQQVGIRETRHIKGVHILTGDEYVRGEFFPDTVARCSHPIDIHSAKDNQQRVSHLKQAAYLPYRSIIAENFPNLLVPSRCFSADREAFASARVQAGVMGLGQAAGVAAAQCNADGRSVIDADIEKLRATLIAWGAYIEKK